MKNSYEFAQSEDGRIFDFVSVSHTDENENVVRKQILFQPDSLTVENLSFLVTNLALVDALDDGSFSDATRSGNRNMDTIFRTLANCVVEFFKLYPNEIVLFRGSDPEGLRTRLYRMQLSKKENYEMITQYVTIYGISDEKGIFMYEPNNECHTFLIRLK